MSGIRGIDLSNINSSSDHVQTLKAIVILRIVSMCQAIRPRHRLSPVQRREVPESRPWKRTILGCSSRVLSTRNIGNISHSNSLYDAADNDGHAETSWSYSVTSNAVPRVDHLQPNADDSDAEEDPGLPIDVQDGADLMVENNWRLKTKTKREVEKIEGGKNVCLSGSVRCRTVDTKRYATAKLKITEHVL